MPASTMLFCSCWRIKLDRPVQPSDVRHMGTGPDACPQTHRHFPFLRSYHLDTHYNVSKHKCTRSCSCFLFAFASPLHPLPASFPSHPPLFFSPVTLLSAPLFPSSLKARSDALTKNDPSGVLPHGSGKNCSIDHVSSVTCVSRPPRHEELEASVISFTS